MDEGVEVVVDDVVLEVEVVEVVVEVVEEVVVSMVELGVEDEVVGVVVLVSGVVDEEVEVMLVDWVVVGAVLSGRVEVVVSADAADVEVSAVVIGCGLACWPWPCACVGLSGSEDTRAARVRKSSASSRNEGCRALALASPCGTSRI